MKRLLKYAFLILGWAYALSATVIIVSVLFFITFYGAEVTLYEPNFYIALSELLLCSNAVIFLFYIGVRIRNEILEELEEGEEIEERSNAPEQV